MPVCFKTHLQLAEFYGSSLRACLIQLSNE
jgi:hypothetical protein